MFRAGLVDLATAGALQAAAATAETLERQLGRLTPGTGTDEVVQPDASCGARWRFYCDAVYDAIRWARDRGVGVIVGTQPFISDGHVEQQHAVMVMLRNRFAGDSAVTHVHRGRTIDLRDTSLAYDGMHMNARGNAIVADAFVEPVLEMAAAMARH